MQIKTEYNKEYVSLKRTHILKRYKEFIVK